MFSDFIEFHILDNKLYLLSVFIGSLFEFVGLILVFYVVSLLTSGAFNVLSDYVFLGVFVLIFSAINYFIQRKVYYLLYTAAVETANKLSEDFLSFFVSKNSLGITLTRSEKLNLINTQAQRVGHAFLVPTYVFIGRVFLLAVQVSCLLYFIGVQFLFVIGAVVLIFLLYYLKVKYRITDWGREVTKSMLDRIQITTDVVSAFKTVICWNLSAKVIDRFNSTNRRLADATVRSNLASVSPRLALEAILPLFLFSGITFSQLSDLGFEQSATISFIALRSIPTLGAIIQNFNACTANYPAFEDVVNNLRVFRSHQLLGEENELGHGNSKLSPHAALELRDVDLLVGDRKLVTGISFQLQAGDVCLIKGRSGTGKSSLLDYIAGLSPNLDPHTKPNSFGRVVYVEQFPLNFEGTVSRNVDIYGSDLDMALFLRVIHNLNLDSKILHREMSSLSGGEKHRVFLAIAISTIGDIYLFDEPTAALSEVDQDQFYETLKYYLSDKVVLVVSHVKRDEAHANRILEINSDGELLVVC